jgi:arginyl-tRNA synthetase
MSELGKEGPSKGELKKMAKKAEKAAKKQEAKGGDAPPAAASKGGAPAAAVATPAVAVATTPTPLAPKLLLWNGSENCPATLKAVWASQTFGVKLGVAKKKDLPAGFISENSKPALILGQDYVLGGGGNAMVKAIALMGGAPNEFDVDEWCEIERTTMRGGKQTSIAKLAATLESHAGAHLVGDEDSMADICILVSLSQNDNAAKETWPASVQTYYNAHSHALERAKALVPKFLPAPAVDLNNDPSLLKVVGAIFLKALEECFPNAPVPEMLVQRCSNPKHGDYQCMAAMPIFASMKKDGTLPADITAPPQVGQVIVKHLQGHAIIQELSIQGPGFILCRLAASYLQTQVQKLVTTGTLPKPNITPTQCVVDFSSPNIAKEMHVGHLRSTIIGEAVCRLLEFVGHDVARINHVGDWGTQFGMLIEYLKQEYPNFAENPPNITDLTVFYKNAKQRFDEDEVFKKTAQTNVVLLQSGDEGCLKIWKILCHVSRQEFQKVYDRLDVSVFECGESFYNDKIPAVIQEFESAGMIRIEEGGAKCVFVDKFKVPLMLQKSDGGYGYDSTDMAALKHRLFTIGAKRIICITDFSQGDHFKMCNTAARDIGWVTDGQKLQHIGFGTVQGEDGKRFKTRSGDTVRLVDLLDEAVGRMEASLTARIEGGKANITAEEVHEVAEAIGYGAVKYFDLRRNPTTNYKFSYDDMLDTKGNTALYLLYARVRLESICAKALKEHGMDVEELIKNGGQITLEHASERNLALQLQNFCDTIELTLDDLFPYHVCDYVYQLAIAASEFVTQCRVLGSPEMASRLLLCHVTASAMHQCFDLLGIRHVKRI